MKYRLAVLALARGYFDKRLVRVLKPFHTLHQAVGVIGDEDVENIPQSLGMYKASVVGYPARGTVLLFYAVFHIIGLVGIGGYLLGDALFDILYIVGVYHSAECIAGKFNKFFPCLTAEDLQSRSVQMNDLLALVGAVREEAARHLFHEIEEKAVGIFRQSF